MLPILERSRGPSMPPKSDPAAAHTAELAALRQPLLRFAQMQLRNEALAEDQSQDEAIEALFRSDGRYVDRPPAWVQPEAALEQSEFMAVMQSCLERLPARLARVFMMREWLERDTEEICAELGITANNAGVMLFRARMHLRECLQARWFGGAA